jgi:hypothetical protein
MLILDLTDEERTILVETLESFLSELRMEIADTDQMDFREGLKRRKAALMKTVEQLRVATVARPS